jgi:hypothetical protein
MSDLQPILNQKKMENQTSKLEIKAKTNPTTMKEDNIPHPSHKNQDNDLTAQGNGDIKPEPEPKMSPLKAEEIPEKNFPRKKNELVNPRGDISSMEKYEPEKSSTQETEGERMEI